jgi:hypothetical protein
MNSASEYFSEHAVTGRKAYVCDSCRRPIALGERHMTIAGGIAGRRWNRREHLACYNAKQERAPWAAVDGDQAAQAVEVAGVGAGAGIPRGTSNFFES